MATLHVRGVPDPLYEWLRATATADGRSIGAELVHLLERMSSGGQADVAPRPDLGQARTLSYRAPVRRRRRAEFFQHFNPRARQVVVDAQNEATSLASRALATDHLLLALLREPATLAFLILEQAGLTYASVRAAVEAAAEPDEDTAATGVMPFTPDAKKAFELALRESISLRAVEIGPEHLLLGVAHIEEGVAAGILADAHQTVRSLHGSLRSIELLPGYSARPAPQPGFRVVELSGEAADWEGQLNEQAALGHELVELVGQRAIFRTVTPG